MTAFQSSLAASDIWDPKVSIEDRILVLSKYISHVLHKTLMVASSSLHDSMHRESTCSPFTIFIISSVTIIRQHISISETLWNSSLRSVQLKWLSLLGFTRGTPIAIFYNQLPHVLATLVNGLADPEVDKRVVEALEIGANISCSMIFEWWSTSLTGLSFDDYRTLKNFTCDLDPNNFNAYTDLYMSEMTVWRKSASKYRSFLMTAIGDMYDFAKLVNDVIDEDPTVEMPFSRDYVLDLIQKLRDSLEDTDNNSTYKVTRIVRYL